MGTGHQPFPRTSFMVSVLMIFISISIQTIFGFTFITDEDEDTIKQNGKLSYNLALSGRRDVFTLRQDDDNEDESNRIMFGVSQHDRGSDNFFPSDDVGFRLIHLGKRRNSIIGTSQWGRKKRRYFPKESLKLTR